MSRLRPGLAADVGARPRASSPRCATNPPPLPADEIAEAVQFLEWLADDNFTLLGARDYAFTAGDDALEPRFETGLGLLRSPETRVLRRGEQLVTVTPEIRRVPQGAEAAHRHQGRQRARACTAACKLDYIGIKHFDARRPADRRMAFLRALHLDRLYPLGPHHSLCAAQDRPHHQPRRLRSRRPFRQGAGQRAGDLPARRIVSDRRRHALSVRARHPAARRAAARARAAAARPLRPLRLGAGLCAARPLRQPHPGADRRLSRPRPSTGGCARSSVLPGRPAGARVFHHRPLRGRNAAARPRRARPRGRGDRAQLDRRARRGARRPP